MKNIQLIILFLLLLSFTSYPDSLSILYLGDTHFGENYQFDPLYNHGTNFIEVKGYDYFFYNVKDILLNADEVFCNLETPLTREINIISKRKPYLHWSDPDSTVKYFNKYNIKFVSLGNNHVMDMGVNGFNNTLRSLGTSGLHPFGAESSKLYAGMPVTILKEEISVINFGGFEYRPNYDTLYHYYASDSAPGVNMLDTVIMNEQIRNQRKWYPHSIIVIYPHWGKNYGNVTDKQIAFAHSWINAGADAVIGHGAHIVQPIEKYNGKYIFYNIGNFIFNAPGRYASIGKKPYGLMVKMFVKSAVEFRLYPVYTNNKQSNFLLRMLNDEERNDLLKESFSGLEYTFSNDGAIILK